LTCCALLLTLAFGCDGGRGTEAAYAKEIREVAHGSSSQE